MALNQFEYFNYYPGYLWRAQDFGTLQEVIQKLTKYLSKGSFGAAALMGHDYGGAVNFDLDVNQGISVDPNGQPLISTTSTTVTAAGPSGGQGRKSLVVARELLVDQNFIADPGNPSNNVPLNTTSTTQIVVIDGTPAGSPTYPSKLTNDVILFGLIIGGADTQITGSSIDYSVRECPGKNSALLNLGKEFSYVVGTGQSATHRTMADLVAAGISGGSSVLITTNETVDSTIAWTVSDTRLQFAKGVTFTKGTAASGMTIAATGVDVAGGRWVGFSGGSDVAIGFTSAAQLCSVSHARFSNCTNEIVDLSTIGTTIIGGFSE